MTDTPTRKNAARYIDNGGAAFPVSREAEGWYQPGMSMRDWFAGQALAGWLASFGPNASHPAMNGGADALAEEAYVMADAMIEARKK